ncbi:hypothetical protein P5V15_011490 [Pogonomyrmex californicus]
MTIKYFTYIGDFTLKEAISICFKEGIADLNRHFEKPTRSEFQNYMKEALCTAKERYRNRIRGPRVRAARRNQDYWNDEREDNPIESNN